MSPFLAEFWERDWHGTTVLHPLGLAMLVLLSVLTFFLPRRHAALPLLVMACFVATAQRIALFGLDFTLLRCLILVGWLRVIFRGEYRGLTWKTLDKLVLAWGIAGTVAYTLQQMTGGALVYRLGFLLDSAGLYFLFRCFVQRWKDVDGVLTVMIAISVPIAVFFFLESKTGRNLFSVFGGVPKVTMIRDGKLRCQGAFSHPIIAGCFWVGVLPWLAARWWDPRRSRVRTTLGVISALAIIYFSASSTPWMGVFFALLAGGLYLLRSQMRLIRWGIVVGLVALDLVMDSPIYHLIARVDVVGGSTGYHRYRLIDAAVHRFPEWALLGTPSTAHWGWYLSDVTNEYVLHAVRGGALTLALFIAILVYGYKGVGQMVRHLTGDRTRRIQAWALGASLFAHTMMFIAVSYFGQIFVIWYLQLALIGSLTPSPGTRLPVLVENRALKETQEARTSRPWKRRTIRPEERERPVAPPPKIRRKVRIPPVRRSRVVY